MLVADMQLRKEHQSVVEAHGPKLTASAVAAMPYTQAVIKESLRLAQVSWLPVPWLLLITLGVRCLVWSHAAQVAWPSGRVQQDCGDASLYSNPPGGHKRE